jgi:hypothetical protein
VSCDGIVGSRIHKEGIQENCSAALHVGPHVSAFCRSVAQPVVVAAEEEGAEAGRVNVVGKGDEKSRVELKKVWALVQNLPNTIQELHEHGGHLILLS